MDLFRRYGHLLRADGTNQLQRLLPALEADYIVPDDRSLADLLAYAHRLAAEVRYHDLAGQPAGDWQPLLELLVDPATHRVSGPLPLEVQLAARDDWPPHLVLLLAFLRIFANVQADLNLLPARHLRYYDEQVLGLQPRLPTPDTVHVVFQPARNAAPTALPAGTRLDAGKDAHGHPLVYATAGEVVVSAATLAGVRRLSVERDRRGNRRFFVAAGFTPLEGPSGYTFGRRQLDLDPVQRFMTEAQLGFAVAAPILALAEGERSVTLLAQLRPPSATAAPVVSQGIGYGVDVSLSGAEGWITPDQVDAQLLDDDGTGHAALSLTLTVGAAAPAVVAYDPALHGPGLAADRPVLRCLVRGESGVYEVLEGLAVERIALSVDVRGVRKLVVQNEDGPLNSAQPMALFGSQPRVGSAFYIGSAEVFGKHLDSLRLNLQWKAPPDDLFDHYRAYFDATDSTLTDQFDTLFRVDVDLLYERNFVHLLANQTLFGTTPASPKAILAASTAFDAAFAPGACRELPDLREPDGFSNASRYGFLRLVLTQPARADLASYASAVPFEAFGHAAFARRYAYQAFALAQWSTAAAPAGPKPLLPAEPYTPVLASLALDYRADSQLLPGDLHTAGGFLTLGPFGATPATADTPAPLVPSIDGEASLLLGIAGFAPPANVSLLFRIAAGTAEAAQVLQPGDTAWSCLAAGDTWEALPASALLVDTTLGFQKTGLVVVQVPREASIAAQALPAGNVWLRATIARAPETAARTVAIQLHAAEASLQPGGLPLSDYADHLAAGLPAGRVARLVETNANIRKVEQPDPSFGGRAEEDGSAYFRRCSERLRHRRRAVTGWDIERLVLEAFPEVFKVKCLPHTREDGTFMAGHAALVVVPDLRGTRTANVLEPRPAAVLLQRIADFLAALAPSFATLHVLAPVFERLRVEADVTFVAGRDPGFQAAVLNEDLRRFLSPWAFEEGEDILFGARIYRSEILAFIEGRDYVDHVTLLNLYHSYEGPPRAGIGFMTIGLDFFVRPNPHPAVSEMVMGDDFVVGTGVEVAEATLPHAILVSHPQHLIRPIARGAETCPGVTHLGIGYMTVALDFNVQAEATP